MIFPFSFPILKTSLKFFTACFLFLFSECLLAKLHFEPYAGYGVIFTSDRPLNIQEDSISDSLNSIKGIQFYHGFSGGARVGYTRLGLAAGLDVTLGRMAGQSNSLTPILYGVFASYKLPVLFRIYGVLIPGRIGSWPLSHIRVIPKHQGDGETQHCEVWGGKAGISYLSLPFISINFEYQPSWIPSGGACQEVWSHSLIAYINLTL